MRLCKRLAAVFVTAAALTAISTQAMAAPMPWETSKIPAGANSVLCGNPCYQ